METIKEKNYFRITQLAAFLPPASKGADNNKYVRSILKKGIVLSYTGIKNQSLRSVTTIDLILYGYWNMIL